MLARQVRYFLAVAEHHSFTRAAEALHVSQPALSQQVRLMEDSLGVQLFDRSGRTTRLTDSGEVYLQYVRRASQEFREAKRAIHDVNDLSRGALRVAVTPTFTTYLVGPLVEAFHTRYPNITLNVREISQEHMEELLLADEVDVGIAFAGTLTPDIELDPLLVETLALVVSTGHPLASETSVGLQALSAESLVLLSAEFATREQIDRFCRQHGIHPHVRVEANSISAVIEIVRRTRLSTLLPATIAFAHQDLVAIALDPVRLQRTAVMMQRKDAYRSAAARVFIELAKEVAIELSSH
ncbi:transcriptional regulator CynR [Sinorhizobium numidicum]|jgi:LysR family cyn operon transcriptional activator|uniref:Transcriptional regulator CynR n=1 Tax=Sinorhizobium numidicum TaxID=680248 RepID=A0ABY8CUA4_9HYPH|nr:transcriptional regulator CynR [Sinorhizobium numidicum]WEX75739.1 transcriptional regulator CynR [Sinorhizobium numidicum]WEX81727.1 transcriptional regulator CynR [Sinorhizobium numidicum]